MTNPTDTVVARSREEALGLIAELDRRRQSARDNVVAVEDVSFADRALVLPGYGDFARVVPLSSTAIGQVASTCNVPGDYARRIYESYPVLFGQTMDTLKPNANRWLVRELDGRARAILSDRYKVLDNYDLAFSVLQEARSVDAEITRWTLTEDKFEVRLIVPSWREDIAYRTQEVRDRWATGSHVTGPDLLKGGSIIIPGLFASNSETGKGGLTVKPFLYDLVCSNGAIADTTLRQIHLGSKQDIGALSRESAEADSKAVWLKVRDLVRAVFDREAFKGHVERFRKTGEFDLGAPVEAVDLLVKNEGLTQDDRQAILNELIAPSHDRAAGGTVLALLNAVTQRAQAFEAEDPEKATALEELGGRILANPQQYVVVRK